MEKEKQILIQKNSYWLSEIGYLFFKYQIGYEVYDYSENSIHVKEGIDLIVLNKQNLPTYIICLGNQKPFDKLFIPISENDNESRLMTSKADYVFFYDINKSSACLLELELLVDRVEKNFSQYEKANINNVLGVYISKDDKSIKDFINIYSLKKDIYEKANQIIKFRSETEKLVLSR